MTRANCLAPALFAAAFLAVQPAQAQSTWTGAASGNWSNASNWSPTGVPANGQNTQLIFGATTNAAMTDDLGGTFILNQMTFSASDPAYSLTGGALAFQSSATPTLPLIVVNSTNGVTIGDALTLTNNLTVNGAGNLTLNGAIGGAGSLNLSGTSILVLGNSGNRYANGTNILSGTVQVAADAALGIGNVTGAAAGVVSFTGTTTTTKSFAMGTGTISVAAGKTVTFNGSQVSGAVLNGPGTIATDPTVGAVFTNSASEPSSVITSNSPNDQFVNFVNGGKLTVPAGVNTAGTSTVTNFNGFTNEGSGAITIGAGSQINVADFQSYGMLIVLPATVGSGQKTLITNAGTTPLYFNSGGQTVIGTAATIGPFNNPNHVAEIDLHGQNLVINGGLFVNNGLLADSVGGASVIVGYGAQFLGAGTNLINVVGSYQVGSPGAASFGSLTLGPGGVQSFGWQIDDALGTAGPAGPTGTLVRGWSQMRSSAVTNPLTSQVTTGNLTWTATSATGNQFDFALQTLLAPTPIGGPNTPGAMDNFNPNLAYVWPVVTYQGTYAGPTDSPTLTADTLFDLSSFANSHTGRFTMAWKPGEIDLVYTPVPEPGTLILTAAGLGLGWMTRRQRAKL